MSRIGPESFRRCLHTSPLTGGLLSDKFNLALPAHILYLLFPNYGAPAIPAKFIIDKLMQAIFGCKAMMIKAFLMLIDSSHEIIGHPEI
jgi:hypothetical protein